MKIMYKTPAPSTSSPVGVKLNMLKEVNPAVLSKPEAKILGGVPMRVMLPPNKAE